MATGSFTALVLHERDGKPDATIQTVSDDTLPDGEVTVAVAYSTLNYKDALAITGKGKIVRQYPIVPGVDFAGTVEASRSPAYKPGDQVVLTGWGVGERTWGGFAQRARVKADWLVPLPAGLSPRDAMGFGTAGLTAALCVMALEEQGVQPGGREVVVTGAAGGVGSVAVALLAQAGYTVVASTGRPETHDYLAALGARQFLDRAALSTTSNRPLESERWGGAIDTVGGDTLASLLRAMAYGGVVAACGLAGGANVPTSVFPFILRGVRLIGVDSVYCPTERRLAAWTRLAHDFPGQARDQLARVAPLAEVPALAESLLAGQVRGRIIVDVNA